MCVLTRCRLTFTVVFLQDTGGGSVTQRGNFSLVECWPAFSYSNDLVPGISADTDTHTYSQSHTLDQGQAKETEVLSQVFAHLQNQGFCSKMWTVDIKSSICKLLLRNGQDKEQECAKTRSLA